MVGVAVTALLEMGVGVIEGLELETEVGLGGGVGTRITVGTEGAAGFD